MNDLPIKFGAFSKTNFRDFRLIMGYPEWNYAREIIFKTRAYEEGLESALALMRLNEGFKTNLDPVEFQVYELKLTYFILNLLDRLDRLEEFMEIYEKMPKWDYNDKRFLYKKGGGFSADYFEIEWRKSIIEKKLARKNKGYEIRRHPTQEKLTDEEIQERFDWICGRARIGIPRRKFILHRIWSLFLSVARFIGPTIR